MALANSQCASPSKPVKLEGINSDEEADLTFENTSSFDSRITGFAFNFPNLTESTPEKRTGMEGFSGDGGWKDPFDPNRIDTQEPFGFFDVAGVTGENLNDGDPEAGIGLNVSKTFRFTFSGTNLNKPDEKIF